MARPLGGGQEGIVARRRCGWLRARGGGAGFALFRFGGVGCREAEGTGGGAAIKVGCESVAAKKLEAGLLGGGGDVTTIRLLGEVAHDPTDMHRRRMWQGGCLLEEALRRRLACGTGGSEERLSEGCEGNWAGRCERVARVLPPTGTRVRAPALQPFALFRLRVCVR